VSITDAIEGGKVFFLVFSSNANASPQIKREVERAVSKGCRSFRCRIEDVPPNRNLEYFPFQRRRPADSAWCRRRPRRSWQWGSMTQLLVRTATGHGADADFVAFRPDGKLITASCLRPAAGTCRF
jgi:hypothetical protein